MATAKIRGGKKLKAFLRKAKAAKGVGTIEVGFYSTAKYDDGTPVTNVAAWNEFGVPSNNVPERPFFRQAVKKMPDPIIELIKAEIDPKTMVIDRQLAERIGEAGKLEVQQSIVKLKEPPNAYITIHGGVFRRRGKVIFVKGKGSSNPLIDEGFMHNSVTYRVLT